jgi:hypothetical protein
MPQLAELRQEMVRELFHDPVPVRDRRDLGGEERAQPVQQLPVTRRQQVGQIVEVAGYGGVQRGGHG